MITLRATADALYELAEATYIEVTTVAVEIGVLQPGPMSAAAEPPKSVFEALDRAYASLVAAHEAVALVRRHTASKPPE